MKIIFGMAAQPSDDMPRPEIPPESYTEYPLVVLSQENNKEIARVTADGQGNYRVPLPPGNYVLDVQDRVRKRVRTRPQPFSVVSNQIAHVDMKRRDWTWPSLTRLHSRHSVAGTLCKNTVPVNEDRNIDTGIR